MNFPRIRKAITLSKIRRLKKDMVKIFLNEPTMLEGYTAVMEENEPIEKEEENNGEGDEAIDK